MNVTSNASTGTIFSGIPQCVIEPQPNEIFIPGAFLNTHAIDWMHGVPRYGFHNDILPLIQDPKSNAASDYLTGLIITSIILFVLFLLWLLVLLCFCACCGPRRVGYFSGSSPAPRTPRPVHPYYTPPSSNDLFADEPYTQPNITVLPVQIHTTTSPPSPSPYPDENRGETAASAAAPRGDEEEIEFEPLKPHDVNAGMRSGRMDPEWDTDGESNENHDLNAGHDWNTDEEDSNEEEEEDDDDEEEEEDDDDDHTNDNVSSTPEVQKQSTARAVGVEHSGKGEENSEEGDEDSDEGNEEAQQHTDDDDEGHSRDSDDNSEDTDEGENESAPLKKKSQGESGSDDEEDSEDEDDSHDETGEESHDDDGTYDDTDEDNEDEPLTGKKGPASVLYSLPPSGGIEERREDEMKKGRRSSFLFRSRRDAAYEEQVQEPVRYEDIESYNRAMKQWKLEQENDLCCLNIMRVTVIFSAIYIIICTILLSTKG